MPDLLFHSFPRRRDEESWRGTLKKGFAVVRSFLDNGLLLAPENFEIPLLDAAGKQVDGVTFLQSRICFTEIHASELENHAKLFGPFSIAFEIDDIRRLGGLPVHYVPLPNGSHLYGLGSEIIGGIADATRVVAALSQIRAQVEKSSTLGLVVTRAENGQEVRDAVRFNEEQTTLVRSFLDEFVALCGSDLNILHQKLLAAGACFYPTEHPTRTGKLHYYRQREWRIVECGLKQNDRDLAPRATEIQKATLRSIDAEFFGKSVSVPAQSRIGEWMDARMVDRCRFLARVGDLDVRSLAKFLVIPDDAAWRDVPKAELDRFGITPIKQSEFVKLV